MALTGQNLWDLCKGLFSSNGDSTSEAVLKRFSIERTKEFPLWTAQTQDCGLFVPNGDILITEASVEPSITQTSDATSFWNFQLVYDDNAGGADTNITSAFTGSATALTTTVPAALTLSTTGGVAVASGKRVALKTTKTSAPTAGSQMISVKVKYLVTG